MASISQQLAEFVCSVRARDFPDEVIADSRRRVLDAVGIGLAASRSDYGRLVARVAGQMGGSPEATTLGFGQRLPASLASLVNATLVHGDDFDDMHSLAMVHISSVVVPPMLAVAERVGATGEEAMVALIAGAEVGLRLGIAAPHRFILRGFHGTSVCGTFAAAAVASRLLRLDESRTAHALGMAGSLSAGILQGLHDGSWVKRIHPGWATQAGITVALLAEEGFTGPARVIEGEAGLYNVFLHGDMSLIDLSRIGVGLGQSWVLPTTSFKRYPTGAWTQAAMDGVAALMEAGGIDYSQIASIDCLLPPEALPVVCEPREAKLKPQTPYQAKFSLPYSVAMRVVLGHALIDDYSDATLRDPRITDLASRVQCHSDERMSPADFPVQVSLGTVEGVTMTSGTVTQRGSPSNPMSEEDHREKFRSNVAPILGDDRSLALLGWIDNIWDLPDTTAFPSLVIANPVH